MKSLFLAIALLLAVIPAAKPASAEDANSLWIEVGNTDCGTWHRARQAGQATSHQGFLVGILNGMSLGRGVEFWRASGMPLTPTQVHLWMDGYCQRNPLSGVVTGATELMNEHTQGAYGRAWRRMKGLGQ